MQVLSMDKKYLIYDIGWSHEHDELESEAEKAEDENQELEEA